MFLTPKLLLMLTPNIIQDTFSFALVLLCLAVGDIAYVRKQGGIIARTAYYSGWRPTVRKSLRVACPEIAALIKKMWLADFRARPAMKDVVVRLEACVFVERATNDPEEAALQIALAIRPESTEDALGLDAFPKREQRFVCTGNVPAEQWVAAIAKLTAPLSMEDWCTARCAEELALLAQDEVPLWKQLPHKSIPEGVRAEWRSTPNTTARLYRFTIPLQCKDPRLAFRAWAKSFGTAKNGTQGDRSVDRFRILHEFDDNHFVAWQSIRMPHPMPKRTLVSLACHDEEHLLTSCFHVQEDDLVRRSFRNPELLRGTLRGESFVYTARFKSSGGGHDGAAAMTFLVQVDLSAGESAFHGLLRSVASIGADRVGVAVCKGARGMAKRVDELSELLSKVSRTASENNRSALRY